MTESFAPPRDGWTVDDLDELPDIGVRYEIFDGSLLVSPAPHARHVRATTLLRDLLSEQRPPAIRICENAGFIVHSRRSYFIPDLFVMPTAAFNKDADLFDQGDALLVIEVLSPSNPGNDLVLKRHYYATGGIRQYWIVDPMARTLTVLDLDGDTYVERAVVEPGQVWQTDEPFPIRLDPADFL
jgi:Uma2 family endonuclease